MTSIRELIHSKGRIQILIIGAVLALVLYVFFHNSYRTEYIDDAWTLSWAYDYWQDGTVTGEVFGHGENGGTVLFSRTTVFLYGGIQSLLGWTRAVGYGISTFLILLSGLLWFFIQKELKIPITQRLIFLLLFVLAEAFFGIAHKIRVDALTFFLVSLSFTLFLKNQYFWAGLVSMVGFENHPYGLAAWVFVFALALSRVVEGQWQWKKMLITGLLFLVGAALGLAYYLALHWEWLHKFSELGSQRAGGNALIAYFFEMDYSWRHLPELGLFALVGVLYFALGLYKKKPFFGIFAGLSILLTLAIPRGNYHYVAFVYPSLFLLTIYVFSRIKAGNLLIVGFLLFQLGQYAILFQMQWGFDAQNYVEGLRSRVESAFPEGLPPIYGHSLSWFAFQEEDFRAYGYYRRDPSKSSEIPQRMLVIKNPDFLSQDGEFRSYEKTVLPYFANYRILDQWREPGYGDFEIGLLER